MRVGPAMRLAINGYGRIGRCVLRAAFERDDCDGLEFVAVNELAEAEALHYLSRYDSTHGRFPGSVNLEGDRLELCSGKHKENVRLLAEPDPLGLPWQELGVGLVLECTGQINTIEQAQAHVQAGANAVLLSNPGEASIPAVVFGVNQHLISSRPVIASAASCTSNALIPALSIVQREFGINSGVITTIHASMHDQPVIDAYHSDDLRKNRAASQSVIPVDTSLAAGVGRILPQLAGKFVAHALRVPVNNVSALNITLNLIKRATANDINQALHDAACGELDGVLGYTTERLASCDFNHDTRSGIIDARQTMVCAEQTANLLVWFDNEWAFANRMLDLALCYAHTD